MSLNWNVSRIADSDRVCWRTADADQPMRGIKAGERYLSPTTEALIWSTLGVGLGEITAANWRRFWVRLQAVEAWSGKLISEGDRGDGRPWDLTAEDVRAHIGLHTNVSRETDSAWIKRWLERGELDLKRRYPDAAQAA